MRQVAKNLCSTIVSAATLVFYSDNVILCSVELLSFTVDWYFLEPYFYSATKRCRK